MHSEMTLFMSLITFLFALSCAPFTQASPNPITLQNRRATLSIRQTADGPRFPDEPKSCPICARNYWNINSCCQAAPVLANFTNVIFNPGAFVDVIMCACGDTFQAVYPQCVDCLQRTGQETYLYASSEELPGIIKGIRDVCAMSSTLLGNVSESNGDVTPSPPPPAPTASSVPVLHLRLGWTVPFVLAILVSLWTTVLLI